MHVPVLKNEVLRYLAPRSNKNFIDCTIGQAGHAISLLERIKPEGKLLGIDWSKETIFSLKKKLKKEVEGERLILINDNFVNLKKIVQEKRFAPVSGILFDLGVSSWQLKESGKGFSFQKNEPLNMQMFDARNQKPTAEEIVNKWSLKEIEKILKEYGEERFAKKIAQEIGKARKKETIETTFQLVEIIKKSVPLWYQHQKIHWATKTFQALRIVVNQELDNLRKALPQALETLKPGGRMVVISFHSLEDRIVKRFFKEKERIKEIKILTPKPIRPSKEELEFNPSSRSARLRAGVKLR